MHVPIKPHLHQPRKRTQQCKGSSIGFLLGFNTIPGSTPCISNGRFLSERGCEKSRDPQMALQDGGHSFLAGRPYVSEEGVVGREKRYKTEIMPLFKTGFLTVTDSSRNPGHFSGYPLDSKRRLSQRGYPGFCLEGEETRKSQGSNFFLLIRDLENALRGILLEEHLCA